MRISGSPEADRGGVGISQMVKGTMAVVVDILIIHHQNQKMRLKSQEVAVKISGEPDGVMLILLRLFQPRFQKGWACQGIMGTVQIWATNDQII